MLKYDEQKIRDDAELMSIVNANNALDDAIYQQAEKLGVKYLDVSLDLSNYNELNKLDKQLESMIDKYVDAHNVPIDEVENVMQFMSDNK